jgi:lycopene beta-cyclase
LESYDYIICGAGCAGLSLAYRLSAPQFSHLRILILDKTPKTQNDRTWSFWMSKDHIFDSIVFKRWNKINFYGTNDLENQSIHPYQYQMIRGIDFYEFTLSAIADCAHIDLQYESITAIDPHDDLVIVETSSSTYQARYIFNSIVERFPEDEQLFVWQHFKGWVIEASHDAFDSDLATFMDFRVDQGSDTRFVYVLPHSSKKALVEATIFSKSIWESSDYDTMLKDYCEHYLKLTDYKILDDEIGAIPMTSGSFVGALHKRVIPIGTLNGTVKPSSGYAFTRIQSEIEDIINQINLGKSLRRTPKKKRFLAYDKTLLNVLLTKKETGKNVFSLLFDHNAPYQIFKFLDEKTSLLNEVRIFVTLPFWSFLKAFIKENVVNTTKTKTK